ncbi:ABC transporter substrate-binding protein [Pleurocapsa sp. CCALA 161]|uniref:ABC transporter substrate-binding protein n=1 Tax=Pleurocapsa sp. CCALA 161 TaxID=2107688 RepID=UPI000D0667E3|nr:ABC transporter substrate-binding protein [Pleurocapsa sp. CCALA 161]PSB12169.1 ABC transporter substrate-binding protein [Pleurocapsa sp. CCALA 161]
MFNQPINITQRNLLLILYVVILCFFGPTVYWLTHREPKSIDAGGKNSIERRVSLGDKILVTAHDNIAKKEGVNAFDQGDYVVAQENFSLALKSDRNDPEARIYLNNTIAAKTKDPEQIGVSVPIGGDLDVAEEILRGVAQAQTEINNNGGINGKLLMVEIANDDNNPELAREIANVFVKDKQVSAVVGHVGSDASIAAAPIYEAAGLVMITPTSSAEALSTIGSHIFRTVPSTRDLADSLANYAVNTAGKSNIAICIDADAQASVSFKENFIWAVYDYGAKVNSLNCDLSAADFNATDIPSQAISSGADALLLAPSVRKVDKAVEIAAVNDDRLTLFGNHSLNTYITLEQGQNDVNGMVLTVPWYPQTKNSFTEDAQKLWGGAVNWRTAMAYDATKTISTGMASSQEREQLQQVLANPEFTAPGATTSISFLPSGDRNLKGTMIKIQPGNESGTGYDFVPLGKNDLVSTKSNPSTATTIPQSLSK